jgi:hypothetical protein
VTDANRFKSPSAPVADVGFAPPLTRWPRALLALLAGLQLLMVAARVAGYVELVSTHALNALGFLAGALGLLCLYIGVIQVSLTGWRGGRAMLAAAILLALATWGWRALGLWVAPLGLGVAIGVAGWLMVRGRGRLPGRTATALATE